jgi:large subunit ribosomal protein L29
MAKVQAKELREKSVKELNDMLVSLQKEQFNIFMKKSTGQLSQHHVLGEARRNIARVKTLISEKAGS